MFTRLYFSTRRSSDLNWELSVRRATSVVRILQNKFDVDGEQLIAAGRSSYKPIAENSTEAGRQKNRRIRIIVLPYLDKFLALLISEEHTSELQSRFDI